MKILGSIFSQIGPYHWRLDQFQNLSFKEDQF